MTDNESLARALLTIAAIETRLAVLEKYLASNGEYLDINALVPLRSTCEAFRNALNEWRTPTTHDAATVAETRTADVAGTEPSDEERA